MRPPLILALILAALPALADDEPALPPADNIALPAPPSPPPVTWVVEGYKVVGSDWVKQPKHCLKTTDVQRAAEYEAEIMRFQNWIARSNVPSLCKIAPTFFESPAAMETPACPANPTFTVWSFHVVDGNWVKDEKHCWNVPDRKSCRLDALAYVAKINAVPGWRATTNAPESTRASDNMEVAFHGPLGWQRSHETYTGDGSGTFHGYSRNGYPMFSEHGGRTIYRPHMTVRLGADANAHFRFDDDDWAQRQREADQRQNELNDMQNRINEQFNRDMQMQQDILNQSLQNIAPPPQ
jgi:hypothetical protein